MFAIELENHQPAVNRVAGLEARVAALEAALARVLGGEPLLPSAEHFAKTQKLSAIDPAAAATPAPATAAPSGYMNLGITAAFASLDGQVAAAAAAEIALTRPPDLGPMVDIDAGLIEDAYARRAPKPRVRIVSNRPIRSEIEDQFPKILHKLTVTWRSREGQEYLKKLIVSDRGDRAGFDPNVMSELMFLADILDAPETSDAWAANAALI